MLGALGVQAQDRAEPGVERHEQRDEKHEDAEHVRHCRNLFRTILHHILAARRYPSEDGVDGVQTGPSTRVRARAGL